MKTLTKILAPVVFMLVLGVVFTSGAAAAKTLTDGTFTVVSFEGNELIIKLEKDSILSAVELVGGGETVKPVGFSNLDDSMTMTADGCLYKAGRIKCTFNLPEGFKAEKLIVKGKQDSKPAEFDVSGL